VSGSVFRRHTGLPAIATAAAATTAATTAAISAAAFAAATSSAIATAAAAALATATIDALAATARSAIQLREPTSQHADPIRQPSVREPVPNATASVLVLGAWRGDWLLPRARGPDRRPDVRQLRRLPNGRVVLCLQLARNRRLCWHLGWHRHPLR
jgi:hypothetical protein